MGEPINWGFSWAVVVTGLVVVFVVLILLVVLCTIMGSIFTSIDKKNELKQAAAQVPTAPAPAPKASVIPVAKTSTDDDDIAAISAAIAVIMGESNTPYAIKSVKKGKDQRNVWNSAGVIENTRQF